MPTTHERPTRVEDDVRRAAEPTASSETPATRRFMLSLLSVFTLSGGDPAAPQLYSKAASACDGHKTAPEPTPVDPAAPWRRILARSLRVLGASALALFGLLLFFWSILAQYPMTPTALIPWLPRAPFGLAAWFLAAVCACGGLLRLASRIDGAR